MIGLDLPAISLDELTEVADLQRRVDRKYLLPATALPGLLAALPAGARILQIDGARTFSYVSLYLDTPDLLAYRLAGQRRRRRFKVRHRRYADSGASWLEVKTRDARGTVKRRTPSDVAHPLGPDGRLFVAATLEHEGLEVDPDVLVPVLRTSCHRTTLHLPGDRARLTIDVDLALDDGGASLRWDGLAVVETKAGRHPTAVDRHLWRSGVRPARISKYGTGLAALHPDLPDLKWHRTLTHDIPAALAA